MFTCKKCESKNLDVILSGPHKKLICLECGSFQKFLGKSEYEAFLTKKKPVQPALKEMHITANKIQSKIHEMLAIMVGRTHPDLDTTDLVCPFFWECKDSPCGYCVYNDSTWSNCIYCGNPYERK